MKSKHIIACRPGCLGVPLKEALSLLKSIGVENAEVKFADDGNYAALAAVAKETGVTITSLSGGVALDKPDAVAAVEKAIDGAASIGTRVIFLSASPGDGSPESGIAMLKKLGERAQGAGVVLSLETHLPYGANGDVAVKTIEAVNSPAVRWNYDTANIFFYNPKGTDGVAELKKGIRYVASVHLKESAQGEPQSFDFPILGQGIVKFAEIFRLLDERGFNGPYTLELEGPLMDGQPTQERLSRVKACVDHLRSIGVV